MALIAFARKDRREAGSVTAEALLRYPARPLPPPMPPRLREAPSRRAFVMPDGSRPLRAALVTT